MRRSKYRAIPTVIDGIRFASKAEARRYQELRFLERAGEITALELQPVFPLVVNGVKIGAYRADFRFVNTRTGEVVTEDCKGFRTKEYKRTKRLVEALYPVQIQEIT